MLKDPVPLFVNFPTPKPAVVPLVNEPPKRTFDSFQKVLVLLQVRYLDQHFV